MLDRLRSAYHLTLWLTTLAIVLPVLFAVFLLHLLMTVGRDAY